MRTHCAPGRWETWHALTRTATNVCTFICVDCIPEACRGHTHTNTYTHKHTNTSEIQCRISCLVLRHSAIMQEIHGSLCSEDQVTEDAFFMDATWPFHNWCTSMGAWEVGGGIQGNNETIMLCPCYVYWQQTNKSQCQHYNSSNICLIIISMQVQWWRGVCSRSHVQEVWQEASNCLCEEGITQYNYIMFVR